MVGGERVLVLLSCDLEGRGREGRKFRRSWVEFFLDVVSFYDFRSSFIRMFRNFWFLWFRIYELGVLFKLY